MRTAPLPANVLASCSARFFVAIPEIERRLALSSKGNCRTIDPSSDWTIKHWPQELFGAAVPPVTPAHLKLNRGTRRWRERRRHCPSRPVVGCGRCGRRSPAPIFSRK